MMTKRLRPILLASLLAALPVASATAQDQCDPPNLVLDDAIYGGPTTAVEPALPELQTSFDEAFRDVCERTGTTPDFEGDGQPATEIGLLNAPEANVMSIYMSDDRQALVVEYPFESEGNLSELPDTAEFHRAIVCSLDLAEEFNLDETACLPD